MHETFFDIFTVFNVMHSPNGISLRWGDYAQEQKLKKKNPQVAVSVEIYDIFLTGNWNKVTKTCRTSSYVWFFLADGNSCDSQTYD